MRFESVIQSKLCVVFFAICFICSCSSDFAFQAVSPKAEKGQIDLSDWDFETDGLAKLDGEWDFYWQQLLTPEQFKNDNNLENSGQFNIPGIWNNLQFNNQTLTADGYATFRLIVTLNNVKEPLALKLTAMASAYRLYVEGKPVAENGTVGTSKSAMKPQWNNRVVTIHPTSESIEMVLLVSNFYLEKGGPWSSISIGKASQIREHQWRLLAIEFFLLGSLVIIALYHFGLFVNRRKERSPLYFGIFSLMVALRLSLVGERILISAFPDFNWGLQFRLEIATVFLCPLLFSYFFNSLFFKEFSKRIHYSFSLIGVCFTVLTFILPEKLSAQLLFPYHVLLVCFCLYVTLFVINMIRKNRPGSLIILLGFFFIFITTVLDIFSAANLFRISTFDMFPFGTFVFFFSQSLVLSMRSSKAFSDVEIMSDELKQKNVALSNLDKLKDEFLANTSHELRTPLHGIIGLAESVSKRLHSKLNDSDQKDLNSIILSGKRLYRLVDDILDFSRLKQGDLKLQRQAVDIYSIVELVIGLSKSLVGKKDLQITNNIPQEINPVFADEYRLQQILHNLIGNAIKFTDSGTIDITASNKGNVVEVSVIDSGCGIKSSQINRIFKKFEQLDSSISRKHQGTGLGLAITKKLVEAHQGAIKVESTEGVGSTFLITLPLAENHLRTELKGKEPDQQLPISTPHGNVIPEAFTNSEQSVQAGSTFSILVVDDDPVNLQVVESQLRDQQYLITTARDGKEALDKIENGGKPDLVLLDVMMPNLSGYELCQILRKRFSAYELPIIFLTAKNQVNDLVKGLTLGANDYLPKPFSQEELIARVQNQTRLLQSGKQLSSLRSISQRLGQKQSNERFIPFLFKEVIAVLPYQQAGLFHDEEEIQQIHASESNSENSIKLDVESVNKLMAESDEKILVQNAIDNFSPIQNGRSVEEEPFILGSHWLIFRLDGFEAYTFYIYRQPGSLIFSSNEVEYVRSIAWETAIAKKNWEQSTIDVKFNTALLEVATHLNDIIYIKGGDRDPHCEVMLDDLVSTLNIRVPLHTLQLFFPEASLLRIHRSYLVNPQKIDMINGPFKNRVVNGEKKRDQDLLLKNTKNETVVCPIARQYKTKLTKQFA